jgi:anti-sigma factor RsiW
MNVSAWLDDELGPADKAAMEQHLQVCRHCQNLLAELQQVKAMTRQQPAYAVSPFFASRVLAEYRRATAETIWSELDQLWRPFLRWAAVAAVILVALLAWPRNDQALENAVQVTEAELLSGQHELIQSLGDMDQVLQFALAQPSSQFGGFSQ